MMARIHATWEIGTEAHSSTSTAAGYPHRTARYFFALWVLPAICTLTVIPFWLHGCDWSPQGEAVITVGSRRVTVDQLQKDMDFISAGVAETDLAPGQIHRGLLEPIIDHYLILEFAREESISVTEDEFQSALSELQGEYSQGRLQEALLRGSADATEWHQRLREQLLVQKVLRKVSADVAPPGYDEIKQYYDDHRDQYTTPAMLRFRQVVTRTQKEANELLVRIQKGEDMGELARSYSVAPEADQDGDVGWIARGQLEESMEKALFSLSEGEISGIVKSPYGYHIFQVTGSKPEGPLELPEVVREIESHLLNEKREAFCRKWVKELRASFRVRVNQKLLDRM